MVRTAGVNLAWQTGHDAELVAAACDGADVVFVCEALTLNAEGPLDLRKILPIGWAVFQDLSSAARAGSAVCWRTSTIAEDGPGELLAGSPAGGGTRARHIASKRLRERATGDSRPYAAFHAPKRSTGLQDEFYASLDRYAVNHPRAVLGGDCNRPPLEVAELLGRRAVQSEVMGIFHPASVPARALLPQDNPWTDHPIIRATLTLPEAPVTNVQIYPGADAKTQWFADDYPGTRFEANCGVLHTTEGRTWPGYSDGATAPNVTLKPDFANKRLVARQHFPVDMSSRALRNLAGGVETNTLKVVQVELVGTCDVRHAKSWDGKGVALAGRDYIFWPAAPDWALEGLGKFLRWCNVEHGIKLQGPTVWLAYGPDPRRPDVSPASYGAHDERMTFEEWRNFYGWCGHQHVPENSHGDPGRLNFARVLQFAKGTAAPAPAPAAPKITDADMTRLAGAIRNARLVAQEVHEKDPTETYVLGIHRQLRAPFDAAAAKSSQF